ncbi:MAG: hypothetical protein AAGA56_01835 [Myxococcota bacterium]
MRHFLPDERHRLSEALFRELRAEYSSIYEVMYRDSVATLRRFVDAGLPAPRELRLAAEAALLRQFELALAAISTDRFDASEYHALLAIAEEARRFGCRLETGGTVTAHFDRKLAGLVAAACSGQRDAHRTGVVTPAESAIELLELGASLQLELDIDAAQELVAESLGAQSSPERALVELSRRLGLAPGAFVRGSDSRG